MQINASFSSHLVDLCIEVLNFYKSSRGVFSVEREEQTGEEGNCIPTLNILWAL